MLKRKVLFIFLTTMLIISQSANARIFKKKKKKSLSHLTSHLGKHQKHPRKSRHFHRGTGPDLKSITTESPYKEDPTNGVNPIEGSK